MKALILALALSTTSAFAQRSVSLTCDVQNPCLYYAANYLGFCIGDTSLRINDRRGNQFFNHLVVGKQTDGRSGEIFGLAADIPVSFLQGNSAIIGNDVKQGAIVNMVLQPGGRSFAGTLTIRRNFNFKIICR